MGAEGIDSKIFATKCWTGNLI